MAEAGSSKQSRTGSRKHGMILLGIATSAVISLLRSRPFRARALTAVIGLLALRGIGQESSSRTMARVAAWDQRQKAHVKELENRMIEKLLDALRRSTGQVRAVPRAAVRNR
jgi:hypothetical protein